MNVELLRAEAILAGRRAQAEIGAQVREAVLERRRERKAFVKTRRRPAVVTRYRKKRST